MRRRTAAAAVNNGENALCAAKGRHEMEAATCSSIEQLMEKIKQSDKQYDADKIMRAFEVADKAHEGQMRSSGEKYITHPLAVASILLDYCMDTDTICAALLHDVVEDTDVTLEELQKKFGEDVAVMVDGVTKIGLVPLNSKEEQQAENIRKIRSTRARPRSSAKPRLKQSTTTPP